MTKEIGSWGIDGMIAGYEYRDFRVYKLAEPSNYIDITVKGYGVQIPNKEARDIAHWILENVPEAPTRDRESDMRKLAEGVLSFLIEWPGRSIHEAIWAISTDPINQADPSLLTSEAVLKYLGIEEGAKWPTTYTSEQLKYGESLANDLTQWIRDRALGISGE